MMATRRDGTTQWSWVLLAGLGLLALPTHAQVRVSLTDLQNQIAASVTCPAALPGQPRFLDKGDGTICDSATGLMWEKKVDCFGRADQGNPHCVANLYTWTQDVSPYSERNGSLYSDFLDNLNGLQSHQPVPGATNSCFVAHCDWRIPTIGELRSILNAAYPGCTANPCIDAIFLPTNTLSFRKYFSSDSFTGAPTYVWAIQFEDGLITNFPKSLPLAARAVRGGR
jgi:Protein of unknown function (DUF1566)